LLQKRKKDERKVRVEEKRQTHIPTILMIPHILRLPLIFLAISLHHRTLLIILSRERPLLFLTLPTYPAPVNIAVTQLIKELASQRVFLTRIARRAETHDVLALEGRIEVRTPLWVPVVRGLARIVATFFADIYRAFFARQGFGGASRGVDTDFDGFVLPDFSGEFGEGVG
jgi:hypothetical protein